MACGPRCDKYSIEREGSQEEIKKWRKEKGKEGKKGKGVIRVYA